jgi:hypothetical protein
MRRVAVFPTVFQNIYAFGTHLINGLVDGRQRSGMRFENDRSSNFDSNEGYTFRFSNKC